MRLGDSHSKRNSFATNFPIVVFFLVAAVCGVAGAHRSRSDVPNGGSDLIHFPSDNVNYYYSNGGNRPSYGSSASEGKSLEENSIPVDFIQKLSNYSVSDLLLHFVDDYEDETILASRFGEEVERSPAQTPKPAACIPELQTIKLVEEADPSIIYLPSCTRIERCGGCCSHKLLSCQPKDVELVSFKVIKTRFAPGNRLKFVGKDVVHIEKHTKCHCDCKVQKSDCSAVQVYKADVCGCVCNNVDEEKKCHKDSSKKLWDPSTCSCMCREISNCSTGYQFDGNLCKCTQIPVRRRYIQNKNDRPVISSQTKEQEVIPESEDNQAPVEYDF